MKNEFITVPVNKKSAKSNPFYKKKVKWYKRLRWDRILGLFLGLSISVLTVLSFIGGLKAFITPEVTKEQIEQVVKGYINHELIQPKESQTDKQVEQIEVQSETPEETPEEPIEAGNLGEYRLTHYYPGDDLSSGTVTGSGKTIWDFSTTNINGADVYTYNDKIVLAAWTKELKATGYNVYNAQSKDTYLFHYNQEVQIKLGGTWYDAIILDSCGASGWTTKPNLVDIFVPSAGNSPASSCEIRV